MDNFCKHLKYDMKEVWRNVANKTGQGRTSPLNTDLYFSLSNVLTRTEHTIFVEVRGIREWQTTSSLGT
jgi:hypothetical protein